MWLAAFGSMTAASRLTGAGGRSWTKWFFLLKPYRFGYRSVIVLGYVFPFLCMLKLRCSVTRKWRQGGQAASGQLGCLPAWMCNSCSLAVSQLGSLDVQQSQLRCWTAYYTLIVFCSSLSFCHGLDMLRDALVINGRCQVFFYNLKYDEKDQGYRRFRCCRRGW